MSVQSGLGDLRASLSRPGEPLFEQLTDLMHALEDASTSNSSVNTVTLSPPHPQSTPMVAPPKRKLKSGSRKTSLASRPEKFAATATKGRHSDSSDEGGRVKQPLLSSSHAGTEAAYAGSDETEGDEAAAAAATRAQSAAPSTSGDAALRAVAPQLLSPRSLFPAESDSFPETLTPSATARHRRKRLVKRMAVDSPTQATWLRRAHAMEVDEAAVCEAASTSRLLANCSMAADGDGVSSCSMESDTQSVVSGEEGGTSDEGRQADDEQSDWVAGGGDDGECMGVPAVRARVPPDAVAAAESSDTDVSQSSASTVAAPDERQAKRWLSKPGVPTAAAINRKLLHFLRNTKQQRYFVSQLRKGERRELTRLAAFYHLDLRSEVKRRRRCVVLEKTSETRTP